MAHYHGQVANLRALATTLEIGQSTVRRYLDLMEHLFLIRQLRPWHENLKKRQVKRPKLYFRDSGVFHHLIGAGTMDELLTNPRLGASWEGFVLEKTLAESDPDQAYFWGTHAGAELDLLPLDEGAEGRGGNQEGGRSPPHPFDDRGAAGSFARCPLRRLSR